MEYANRLEDFLISEPRARSEQMSARRNPFCEDGMNDVISCHANSIRRGETRTSRTWLRAARPCSRRSSSRTARSASKKRINVRDPQHSSSSIPLFLLEAPCTNTSLRMLLSAHNYDFCSFLVGDQRHCLVDVLIISSMHHVYSTNPTTKIGVSYLESLLQRTPMLTKLEMGFSGDWIVTQSWDQTSLLRLHHLTELSLGVYKNLSLDPAVFAKLTGLRKLKLQFHRVCNYDTVPQCLESMPWLHSLTLVYLPRNFGAAWYANWLPAMASLKTLKLFDMPAIDPLANIPELLQNNIPNIEELHVCRLEALYAGWSTSVPSTSPWNIQIRKRGAISPRLLRPLHWCNSWSFTSHPQNYIGPLTSLISSQLCLVCPPSARWSSRLRMT